MSAIPKPGSREEAYLMETLAMAFRAVADEILKTTPADVPLVASSMGLAATQMLFAYAKDSSQALEFSDILAKSGRQSMADMVAKSDAHQVMQ